MSSRRWSGAAPSDSWFPRRTRSGCATACGGANRRMGRTARLTLLWMLLTTTCEAGTGLDCDGLRWWIECFFQALKVAARIEDRRLDAGDNLRKCLAFDMITAFRVGDLSLPAREKPNDLAGRHHRPSRPKSPAGDNHRGLRRDHRTSALASFRKLREGRGSCLRPCSSGRQAHLEGEKASTQVC